MAILNFPTSPALNDTYSFNGKTWVWNGQGWQLQNQGAINSIVIGNSTPAAGTFTTLSATGNITGSYIIGNGSQLTGLPASYANANVAAYLASGTDSSNIITTANVTGGNVSAGAGSITVGGLTLSGNTIVSTGSTLTIDPNGSGGNDGQVTIAGNLQVTGNVTYVNSNVITINDLFINVANNAATASEANGGGIGVGPVGSEYASFTYNSTSNTWVISNGANVSGNIGATGNITGDYFIGNGSQLTGISASSGAGNLWVVGRSATYYTPIINGILNIIGRTGNISVPINT